jgi:hypothetical protein
MKYLEFEGSEWSLKDVFWESGKRKNIFLSLYKK